MPTVLITGANRGIGLEFVRQFAADGWRVVATVRDPAEGGELEGLDGARIEQLAMLDLESVAGFGARIDGPLDLLIANAGTWAPENAATAEDGREWAEMLTVNAIAPFLLAKALLGRVAEARGKLVAISSRMGSIAEASGGHVPYRSSKAALNMAWRSLAIEARPLGVAAAVLNPGWVKTRMGGPRAPLPVERSVAAMRAVIDSLGPERSGAFLNHDGTAIPW
ncbi:MAG TPA: SDR family oxidoreductase [Sphingomicrobium sp.]|nr:SDR family oxidoreductase [Sphingomicrobium sp.]